ncbi:hypothetical protein [Phenylobacterium sp.]|uniref:hypothetical protein n=1 Tax=Phenylobacterium sp. TaxID=1871053 RepID=UPI002CE115DE|nr:hypothetical protein [Phenylobacterium sp.]HVI33727.1 hypothetical protein [Phenylobacterium sp.]
MTERGTTAILATLAAAGGLLSLGGLVVLNTGATLGPPPLTLGFSQGYDEAAYRRVLGSPSAADVDWAERKSREALAVAPYENSPRLRLAYIDFLRHGRLTPAGVQLFSQSYDLLPVDPNIAAWRIGFGLEHWEHLTPDARRAVYEEARAFHRLRSRDVNVPRVLASVRNPSGRLAAALWISSFDRHSP